MNRLWIRLSAMFVLVAWVGIAVTALVVQRTTEQGFRHYLNQRSMGEFNPAWIERLEAYYAERQTWVGSEAALASQGFGGGQRGGARRGATFLIADPDGVVVAATDRGVVGTRLDEASREQATPLRADGEVVGLLYRQTPGEEALGEVEMTFLTEANRWLTLAAVFATALALIVGTVLAWGLTRPLRALAVAAGSVAAGHFGRQVPANGVAEVRELAERFNTMSRALADGEAMRRRMAADIAHELRTPVTVLRGHLEAMLDGVYPADQEHISVAHDQTIYLARLVEDLRLLTLAEARQLPLERAQVAVKDLIAASIEAFQPLADDAGISLNWRVADEDTVWADAMRIRQVMNNLVTNALRHTSSGGTISVSAARHDGMMRFSVANPGSQLADEDLAHVFEPFWRSEGARERDTGGSGLGLAIAQQIISAHGGRLWAERRGAQLIFSFELPLSAADKASSDPRITAPLSGSAKQ